MQVRGTKAAFIGTGVMGASMAGHLLKAGVDLTVYTRTKAKARKLLEGGAKWANTPAEAVKSAQIVFTMVGYPKDVEEVYFGPDGIIKAAPKGCLLVDFTTSEPALAVKIAARAEAEGLLCLDAPVSGGDTGAKNATLTIMVGGKEEAFAMAKPFFDVCGKNAILQGGPGAGQHTKMSNQISVVASLMGTVESLLYAEKAGLDPHRVLESIGGGAAQSWQLTGQGPRMLSGDFEPGFYSKHFLKDLSIALNSAKSMGLKTPMLELAELLFQKMIKEGLGDRGSQALYLLYKDGKI